MLQQLQRYVQQSFRSIQEQNTPLELMFVISSRSPTCQPFRVVSKVDKVPFPELSLWHDTLRNSKWDSTLKDFPETVSFKWWRASLQQFWDWWIVVFVRCIETWLFFRKKEPFNHWHSVMAWKSRKFRGFQPPLLVWLLVGGCTFKHHRWLGALV